MARIDELIAAGAFFPGKRWTLMHGTDGYNALQWLDPSPKPTEAEFLEAMNMPVPEAAPSLVEKIFDALKEKGVITDADVENSVPIKAEVRIPVKAESSIPIKAKTYIPIKVKAPVKAKPRIKAKTRLLLKAKTRIPLKVKGSKK